MIGQVMDTGPELTFERVSSLNLQSCISPIHVRMSGHSAQPFHHIIFLWHYSSKTSNIELVFTTYTIFVDLCFVIISQWLPLSHGSL